MRHLLFATGLTAALAALSPAAAQEQLFRGAFPPRDPRTPPAAVGTAVIRGHVFAGDTGRPLRRARVQVSAPELGPEGRTTSTNLDGRFEIRDLPAGRYTIAVNRSGYLRLSYGQRRPFEQGKPLQVADKQLADNIDFTLPRMSLITGRVFDETNEPMAGVRVFAMRTQFFEGRRRLAPVSGGPGPVGITDDAGQYRLTGLAPGSYFVLADSRETWTVSEGANEQVMGYAPTYYPGATTIADGKRVTVGLGQEASNIDLAMIQGRAATVSGMAVDSQGRPLAGRTVAVRQGYRSPGFFMIGMAGQSAVGPDGTFAIKNVPPGEYTLTTGTTTVDASGARIAESGSVPIAVNGVDLASVTIKTSAGWSLAGSIRTETGEAPGFARERVRVRGRMLDPDASPTAGPPGPPPGGPGLPGAGMIAGGLVPDSGRVREDWTFTVGGLFGAAQVRVNLPDGWAVKSVMQDGHDITDAPMEAGSGETIAGVEIVVTNRVTRVTGELTDEKGAPVTDGTVIVFATEPERWSEDSRFVQSARPDQNGKYQIQGLPAGDYLAVAIDYVEEGMWNDPEYLESIRVQSQRLTLGDGESRALPLKVVSGG